MDGLEKIGSGRECSQLDVAPTAACVLGLALPGTDGRPIEEALAWGCRDVALVIIDSLGYDLFSWLRSDLENISRLASDGLLLRARAVSNRTTPAIASILSGLLPQHHGILDKAGAKESSIPSLPEIASAEGLSCAVVMEQNGADVYRGKVGFVHGISDRLPPREFDEEVTRVSTLVLHTRPRLLVTYFIGIDRCVHLGQGPDGIREAALTIDRGLGEMMRAADDRTLFMICGDHPIHAGPLKRVQGPHCVAMILGRGRGEGGSSAGLR